MISKWKISLIAFLISLTLFSVGFSSWSITNKIVETVNGTINSDAIMSPPDDVTKLVTLDAVECFDYNANGIVHKNADGTHGSIDTTATVTAYFSVYPQALKTHFEGYDLTSVSVESTLTYSGTTESLFGENCTYAQSASLGTTTLTCQSAAYSNVSYRFTAVLNDILNSTEEKVTLAMNFTFTIKNYSAFYEAIGDLDNFEFYVSSRLMHTETAV
ncbi:MAG: hypothetical protein IKA72_04210 [Clostridia bacterium]|nr:hypothetical protein [Clostridia bacterium]